MERHKANLHQQGRFTAGTMQAPLRNTPDTHACTASHGPRWGARFPEEQKRKGPVCPAQKEPCPNQPPPTEVRPSPLNYELLDSLPFLSSKPGSLPSSR
jgi:hypothetical protein